jgi:hypothetical protein
MKIELRLLKSADTSRDDCWRWTGKVSRDGYGRMSVAGRYRIVHRLAHDVWIGPIPEGLEVDHLCQVKLCINPAHLEAVTHRENMHRQPRIGALLAQTECVHGHDYTAENTMRDTRGNRRCRTCHNARERARKAAKRAA